MRAIRTTLVLAIVTVGGAMVRATPASGAATPSPYTIWTIAGSSAQCTTPPSCGDGGAATAARLSFPQAVTVGRGGDVFIADWGDNEVREVSPAGTIRVIAGEGTTCQDPPDCGDGGRAADAQLSFPDGVAVNSAGDVYIADSGDNEIRKVTPTGGISRVAGTGSPCAKPPACGDGGPGTAAPLNDPTGLVLDRHGNLYIADTGDQEIRELSSSGTITRVAGTGKACRKHPACGDGNPGTSAQLSFPQALALGPAGKLYIADTGDQEIRELSPSGTITRVAGTGKACLGPPSCGDSGPATSAQLAYPAGVAVDGAGRVFIADTSDNELRVVSAAGTISRVAGTGTACANPPACGDSQRGSSAAISYPEGLAMDGMGNLYLADTYDNELRWLSTVHAGRLQTPAGPVALAAFATIVNRKTVTIRYVLGRPATLTLDVSHRHHSEVAGSTHGGKGFGELVWKRVFRSRPAGHGRYALKVMATIGQHHTTSTISVRL